MDIKSSGPYPSNLLSNFANRSFVLDTWVCRSPEAWIQSLKIKDRESQLIMMRFPGYEAKVAGRSYTKEFHESQKCYWNGVEYDRHDVAYQDLLDRAYRAMYNQSMAFQAALRDTGNAILTHSIGSKDPRYTVLTENEFCSRLMELRDSGCKY